MKKFLKGVEYEKYYREILPYLKKEKNQQYFYIILTIGASIFFALFAINPTVSTIFKLRKEINDSRFVETRLKEKIASLSNLSEEYLQIQKDIPTILDAIPEDPKPPVLVAQIQSLAQESNVDITKLEISTIGLSNSNTKDNKSAKFSFQLTAVSNYESINKFITELTNMQRVISIDSISITKAQAENESLELKILGSSYFKKQ